MENNNRLIQPISSHRYSLCIDSAVLAEEISFIKKNNIESVTLIDRAGGYTLDNIDFLHEVPFLKEIYMASCSGIKNYNGLSFVDELSVLVFSPNNRLNIDLSNLCHLDFLSFQYSNNIKGLEALSNISKLWVWGGDAGFFSRDIFSSYKKLSEIEINRSILDNLYFMKDCPITTLVFNQIKSDFTLAGLSDLSQTLTTLKFIKSKQVRNLNQISSLTNLTSLILSDSFVFDNCEIVANLKNLESLTLVGSSFFKNGNLSAISSIIKNLKHNNISHKRHYEY